MRTALWTLIVALTAWPALAMNDADWDHWRQLSRRQCPNHHVTWVCDGCYLQLTVGFAHTLTRSEQMQLVKVTEFARCADEVAGFSCEMAVSLKAYDQLGLMHRFVNYTCKTVKCEEAALCSRMPSEVD